MISMRTIIFPGYSLRNKGWGGEIAKDLDAKLHYWKHWAGGSLSVKYEVGKILEEIGDDEVNILAKSIGTMVAMHTIQKIPGRVEKIILCGIPSTSDQRLKLFQKSLAHFPSENIIVFQNEKDPLGNYKEVKKFMSKVNPRIKVVKMPRSDHNYPYPEEFRKFLL